MDGIPDQSSIVENDVIHLVDVGVDPEVLVNNTTYPIEIQELDDKDIAIKLDKFQTKVTPITDDELYAISYDKMQRVKESHSNSINDAKFAKAAHSFCAKNNTATTPVLKTTGPKVEGTNRPQQPQRENEGRPQPAENGNRGDRENRPRNNNNNRNRGQNQGRNNENRRPERGQNQERPQNPNRPQNQERPQNRERQLKQERPQNQERPQEQGRQPNQERIPRPERNSNQEKPQNNEKPAQE